MSDTILDSVALAYQPIWNSERRLAAVRVGVLAVQPDAVDGAHLLASPGRRLACGGPFAEPLIQLGPAAR